MAVQMTRSLLLKVIAKASLQELRQFVDQFLGNTNGVSFKNEPSRAVSLEQKHARRGQFGLTGVTGGSLQGCVTLKKVSYFGLPHRTSVSILKP